MKEDSIDGIFETLTSCALITKTVGDIGLHIHCIRAANSYIAGTNGVSNGLVPMLRVYDSAASYVKQGGSKVTFRSAFQGSKLMRSLLILRTKIRIIF